MYLDCANPMNMTMRALLVFEVVIVWLAFPGMLQVEGAATAPALIACLAATALLIVSTGIIKRPAGWYLGWLGQVVLVALGVLTPWMFAMGIIFVILWVTAFILGKRIEAHRRADA